MLIAVKLIWQCHVESISNPDLFDNDGNRWGSTYFMVDNLLKLKEICEDAVIHGNQDLFLPPETWDGLAEIRTTLQPIYTATKQLQAKNLTLTDVRKIISVCWMKTAEIGNDEKCAINF